MMRLNIEEMRKAPLNKERLAYNSKTRNRIDVEVYLYPLRAMYKVGKEGDDESNLFDDLKNAIDKFNNLEGMELDVNGLEGANSHLCELCEDYIEEDNVSVCDKCASGYKF